MRAILAAEVPDYLLQIEVSTSLSGVVTDAETGRPIEGFALPRFGAACPHWPLYRALARPMVPIRARIAQPGRGDATGGRVFTAYAVALPTGQPGLGREPLYEAHMLILPDVPGGDITPVGATCRICPVGDCEARREPSIMAEGV